MSVEVQSDRLAARVEQLESALLVAVERIAMLEELGGEAAKALRAQTQALCDVMRVLGDVNLELKAAKYCRGLDQELGK
jgi:hypothetical protein